MAKVGDIIDGKYEILTEIGRGGMSVVYLARDRRLNKQWAIKEAKKNPGANSAIFEMTPIAEANLLKSLEHSNIVRIVDIIEYNNLIYIVEDFVEGNSLNEEVKRGPSSPKDVIRWGKQLCDVFTYLHSRNPKIIYRDMKPANVQLSPDRKTVKLLDFGIAKTYKPQKVGDTTNLGTRGYAAPEQFDAKIQSDERTDIFSLGVTLRSLLMGKTPFDVDFYGDMRRFNPYVTDGLVRVIEKATNPEPAKRFKTAAEFKQALVHYHDYDAKVIASRKKKLNQFRGVFISSIACLCIGLVLLPTAFLVRSSNADALIAEKRYVDAIQLESNDLDNYKAYLKNLIEDKTFTQSDRNEFSDDATIPISRGLSSDNQKELYTYIVFTILEYSDANDNKEKLNEINKFIEKLDENETKKPYSDLISVFKKINSFPKEFKNKDQYEGTDFTKTLSGTKADIDLLKDDEMINDIAAFLGVQKETLMNNLSNFAGSLFVDAGKEILQTFINDDNIQDYKEALHNLCPEKKLDVRLQRNFET